MVTSRSNIDIRALWSWVQDFAGMWVSAEISKVQAIMLYDALVLLVIALVATLLGFGGIAGEFAMIGKVLCGLFLILFILSLIISGIRHPVG